MHLSTKIGKTIIFFEKNNIKVAIKASKKMSKKIKLAHGTLLTLYKKIFQKMSDFFIFLP